MFCTDRPTDRHPEDNVSHSWRSICVSVQHAALFARWVLCSSGFSLIAHKYYALSFELTGNDCALLSDASLCVVADSLAAFEAVIVVVVVFV